jgi:hypothetical protein
VNAVIISRLAYEKKWAPSHRTKITRSPTTPGTTGVPPSIPVYLFRLALLIIHEYTVLPLGSKQVRDAEIIEALEWRCGGVEMDVMLERQQPTKDLS